MPAGWNFDGLGGPTRFNTPASAVRDRRGNWYVADQGNARIRIIRADADDLPESAPFAEWVESLRNNVVESFGGGEPLSESGTSRVTRPDYSDSGDGGPISAATFRVDVGADAIPQMRLAIDVANDRLYVADTNNHRVRVIDLASDPPAIDTYAGGGTDLAAHGVDARQASLRHPRDVDLVPDGSGDLIITDTGNHCVRLVERRSQLIRTIAGVCGETSSGYEGDGGPATSAQLDEPGGSGVAADRTVYVADTQNHRVRRVNPER